MYVYPLVLTPWSACGCLTLIRPCAHAPLSPIAICMLLNHEFRRYSTLNIQRPSSSSSAFGSTSRHRLRRFNQPKLAAAQRLDE